MMDAAEHLGAKGEPRAKPPTISHIVLELAREPQHPFGDPGHVYHLYLPLLPDGRIDAEGWRRSRSLCRVRRLRTDQAEVVGRIVHGPGGHWHFEYPHANVGDEAGFRLQSERFVPGEYVSIREDDDCFHTFQVIAIKPI